MKYTENLDCPLGGVSIGSWATDARKMLKRGM